MLDKQINKLKEHAKKFNLDEEEQEILADFKANHANKPQITEERKKELASLANASSYCTKTRHSKA